MPTVILWGAYRKSGHWATQGTHLQPTVTADHPENRSLRWVPCLLVYAREFMVLFYRRRRFQYHRASDLLSSVIAMVLSVCLSVTYEAVCSIDPSALGDDTQDRSAWRTLCHESVTQFEDSRVEALEHKRAVRKGAQPRSNLSAWPCDSCSRVCSSRIGLHAHQRTHR